MANRSGQKRRVQVRALPGILADTVLVLVVLFEGEIGEMGTTHRGPDHFHQRFQRREESSIVRSLGWTSAVVPAAPLVPVRYEQIAALVLGCIA